MAKSTSELQIVISAKDEASSKLKQTSSSFMTLSNAAKAAAAAAAAFVAVQLARKLVDLGKEIVLSASRLQELELALGAIARANGITAEETENAVNALRDNNIAHKEALQIAAKFIQSELSLADAVKISTAAKDLAIIAGMDSSDATNTLTDAIVANEVMLLRQFGIVTTVDKVLEQYGETIGKTSQELTEAERKQAFLNVVLESAENVTGAYDTAMGSASKQLRSMSGRIIPDLIAQLGLTLDTNSVLNTIVMNFNELLLDATTWLKEVTDASSDTHKQFNQWLLDLDAQTGIITFFKDEWSEIWRIFKEELIPTIIENKEVFIDLATIIGVVVVGGLVLFTEAVKVALYAVNFIIEAIGTARDLSNAWGDSLVHAGNRIAATIDWLWGKFQGLIDKINELKNTVSNIGSSISDAVSGAIPGFAEGGIVTKPTLAMVGEAGPEAIIPLNSATGAGGISVNFNNVSVRNDNDLSVIVNTVKRTLNKDLVNQQLGT